MSSRPAAAGASLPRRLALVALAAVLGGCDGTPGATGAGVASPAAPGAPGIVVVTAGGTALDDGAADVPPTLDLRLSADTPLSAPSTAADLDGAALPLRPDADALAVSVPPMPLGSAHTLTLRIPGRDDERIGFHVVGPGEAFAALHVEPGRGLVLDIALSLAPVHPQDVVAVLPAGGAPVWVDSRHLRATWRSAPPGAVHLAAGLAVERGSTLGASLDLALAPVPAAGTLRSALAAPSPAVPTGPVVVAFSVATAASRASVAAHIAQVSVLSPSGLTTDGAGALDGAPDAAAVASARSAGVPVWPLVQNAGFDAAAVHALLTTPAAAATFITALRAAARAGAWAGIVLDLENVAAGDRDALSALVGGLAGGLHADGRRLGVAVVPHRPGHDNAVNAAYDLAAIGAAADLVDLMAYEEHSPSTDPGPVAGLAWDSQVLDGSLAATGSRALLGVALYARTWEAGGDDPADAVAPAVAAALGQPGGARADYDFVQGTPSIAPLGGGLPVTWFDDAPALARKLALAGARGVRGVALWRLGFEDPALWALLPARAVPA